MSATVHYADDLVTLYHGDCRQVLATLPDASVSSIVTDPPYELGFMGRGWDSSGIAYSVEMWAECLRVLKPGGHALVFGGTRTYHRMACAMEDAGFEVRDSIHWTYGSGFPKSLDVSKAIDRAGGVATCDQSSALRAARERADLSRDEVAAFIGCSASSVRDWEEGRARTAGGSVEYIVPSPEYRSRLADLLGYPEDQRRAVGAVSDRRGDGSGLGLGHSGKLTAGGNTTTARQWQGWGTALKPSHEPIIVARKPLIGTVAQNVLAHGTGALNIDACRVGTTDQLPVQGGRMVTTNEVFGSGLGVSSGRSAELGGRWPANTILTHAADCGDACADACPVADLDGQSGPSRFFLTTNWELPTLRYEAKANTSERPVDPDTGRGHPTVKPLALMRWLVRLVTPPGGVVLEPFAGSGTTLEAAVIEGFHVIGIELEAGHLPIITARLTKPIQPDLFGSGAAS